MKIMEILLWILFIVSVVMALWYLFGSSPTLEQSLLLLILTMSITTLVKVSVFGTKFKNLEISFIKLVSDFKEHIKHK